MKHSLKWPLHKQKADHIFPENSKKIVNFDLGMPIKVDILLAFKIRILSMVAC